MKFAKFENGLRSLWTFFRQVLTKSSVESNKTVKIAWEEPKRRFKILNQPGVHLNIRYILGFATVMGVFPVCKVTSRSTSDLHFKWFSVVTIYTMVLLSGFLVILAVSIDYSIQHLNQANLTVAGGFKKATSGTIFYGNAFAGCFLFLQLSRVWPELSRKWHTVEMSMQRFGQPRLFMRFITITMIFMSLAFAEHGLHNWLNVRRSLDENINCGNRTDVVKELECYLESFSAYMKVFALTSHWYLFSSPDKYATWKGLSIVWLSLIGTFIWNFTDLFIMLISSALAAQFNILNKTLRLVLPQFQWREYREMYASLTHLVKTVDSHVNKIIIISVASNVYFICAQLITEIDSIKQNYISSLFYLYSFLFLVARITAVVIQAAAIHDESLLVAPELFLCPPQSYCTEVQRFLQEVNSDSVYLTGLNMFAITRNFLLGISMQGFYEDFLDNQSHIGRNHGYAKTLFSTFSVTKNTLYNLVTVTSYVSC